MKLIIPTVCLVCISYAYCAMTTVSAPTTHMRSSIKPSKHTHMLPSSSMKPSKHTAKPSSGSVKTPKSGKPTVSTKMPPASSKKPSSKRTAKTTGAMTSHMSSSRKPKVTTQKPSKGGSSTVTSSIWTMTLAAALYSFARQH